MKSKRNVALLALAVILISATGFKIFLRAAKHKPSQPNVIIISLTNLSANHMSSYGYEKKTTPYLDSLAEQSYFFENAFTQSSWTLPAANSMFTSTYPYTHRIMKRYEENILSKELKTLTEVLKLYDYKTAAFTGGGDFRNGHGLERGFDSYDKKGGLSGFKDKEDFSSFKGSIEKAEKWLDKNRGKKFFLFLQGYDMHPPFTPPKPFDTKFWANNSYKPKFDTKQSLRGFKNSKKNSKYVAYYYLKGKKSPPIYLSDMDVKYLESQYDGEIAYVDELINRFLTNMDQDILDKSYIVFVSEHGEMFGKHGRFGRAGTIRGSFYDDVMKVPLIIKPPGQTKGKKVQGLVQLIDIAPTILSLLDIQRPARFQGKDLLPLINDGRTINRYVYAGSDFGNDIFSLYENKTRSEMIRDKNWKLIREIILKNDKPVKETLELYDIKNDPDETNNLALKKPNTTDRLKLLLFDWAQQVSSKYKNQYYPIPKELEEEAKKHGYW